MFRSFLVVGVNEETFRLIVSKSIDKSLRIWSGNKDTKYEYLERFASKSGNARTLVDAPPSSDLASRIKVFLLDRAK
ncbi:unannotated protein [freshwater metagenome]|uniref:Unannotated protein n=1 Tax=freshwater metagenome TaxID=449393 RepID=A0A6J6YLC7_9ZZZZ